MNQAIRNHLAGNVLPHQQPDSCVAHNCHTTWIEQRVKEMWVELFGSFTARRQIVLSTVASWQFVHFFCSRTTYFRLSTVQKLTMITSKKSNKQNTPSNFHSQTLSAHIFSFKVNRQQFVFILFNSVKLYEIMQVAWQLFFLSLCTFFHLGVFFCRTLFPSAWWLCTRDLRKKSQLGFIMIGKCIFYCFRKFR